MPDPSLGDILGDAAGKWGDLLGKVPWRDILASFSPTGEGFGGHSVFSGGGDSPQPSRFSTGGDADAGIGGSAAPPRAPAGGDVNALVQWAKQNGFTPIPNAPGWFVGPDGKKVNLNPGSLQEGSGDGTGMAQVGLGYAQLAEQRAQFAAKMGWDKERAGVEDKKWQDSYDEGKRQFQAGYDRSVFTSDRAFKQAEEQFGLNFAENKRQFDTRLGADTQMFDARLLSEEGRAQQALQSEESRFAANLEYQASSDRARLGQNAEQMAGEQSRFDRQASLAEQQNRQEVLRNPSDFVSRAFESRGETSPTTRITHADLINQVAAEAAAQRQAGAVSVDNARRLASGVTAPTFTLTPRMAPTAPISQSIPTAPVPVVGAGSSGATDGGAGLIAAYNASIAAQQPRMAAGGYTTAPQFEVGDSVSGTPTGHEEIVGNPTGAPLTVTPANAQTENPEAQARMKKADAIGKVIQHVDDPDLQHALIDEMAHHRGTARMPRFATGTAGYWDGVGSGSAGFLASGMNATDWNALQASMQRAPDGGDVAGYYARLSLRNQAASAPATASAPGLGYTPVTQDELIAEAKRLAPPSITALSSGNRLAPYRAALPGITPRRLAMQTGSERQALNSYLGVVHNTTLADEADGMAPTFGNVVGRQRARMTTSGGY